MRHLTAAVRQAIDQENWYAALGLALTLPDICGRIESPRRRSQERYIDWCDRYLAPRYSISSTMMKPEVRVMLRGSDCYALRCAVLHEGADDIVDQRAREALAAFEFVAPPPADSRAPGLVWNLNATTLRLQVDIFCEAICEAVDEWEATVVAQDEGARVRAASLMTVRSHGPSGGAEGTMSMSRVLRQTRDVPHRRSPPVSR